jgi:hypothetical protein
MDTAASLVVIGCGGFGGSRARRGGSTTVIER